MPEPRPLLLPTPRQYVNELLAARAFERGEALALHQPLELHVQVASGCNLDCLMCTEHLRPPGARHGKNLKVLSEEVFTRLEREVFPHSWRVHFGVGGEPMLAPELPSWIARARAANQSVYLTTNGTRISTDAIAEILARDLCAIEISIDGATAATYERIRFGARFDVIQRNFERLARARRALAPHERAHVRLCFVIMRSNVHELPLLVELAARYGFDAVAAWHVIPVTPEGRAESIAAEPELWAGPVAQAKRRARALGIAVDLPEYLAPEGARATRSTREEAPRSAVIEDMRARDARARAAPPTSAAHAAAEATPAAAAPEPFVGSAAPAASAGPAVSAAFEAPGPRVHCHMPTLALYLFYDGRVYPCGHPHVHAGAPLGDLTRQSFAEVWNGRRYRNLRAGLARGEAPPVCRGCELVRGGAPGPRDTPEAERGSDLGNWYGARDLAPFVPELEADAAAEDPGAVLVAAGDLGAWRARALAAERERAWLALRSDALAEVMAARAQEPPSVEVKVGRLIRGARRFARRLLRRDRRPLRPAG